MASRMERMRQYHDQENGTLKKSRTDKHKDLYEDFYTKTVYKEISSVGDALKDNNAIDLSEMSKPKTTREGYHKVRELSDFMEPVNQRKSNDLSVFFQEEEKPKVYDINSVLAEAKKNREEPDELEKRRKLKNTDYNILTNLNKETQSPKKTSKKTKDAKSQEEELEELIHTITSSSLREEIEEAEKEEEDDDKDLLSDLMPTNVNETLISEELSKAILDKENEEKETESSDGVDENGIDRTFYTRSMDLSDQDFDEEMDDDFTEEKHPFLTFLKVFLALVLVVSIAILVFYLMNQL